MSSSDSYDEKDVKSDIHIAAGEVDQHHLAFKTDQVDTGAQLVAGEQIELDPAEARRIRKKIDWHILPLMCSTCNVCFTVYAINLTIYQVFIGFNSWIRRHLAVPQS